MIDEICLNDNDPQVQLWYENVGPEETYRQYVLHGDSLPNWEDYSSGINIANAKSHLKTILPSSSYKYKHINTILSQLPIGTQAAFWKDTFYFKDSISKGELGEEAFHSIISTVFTNTEREEFYKVGEDYLKAKNINISQEVKYLSEVAPETYIKLTPQQRRERVVEEFIAKEFREHYINNTPIPQYSNRIVEFFTELFNTIKQLFTSGNNSRDYINSLFKDITDGKYRNAKVVYSENATPSTYLIIGKSNSGVSQEVGEAESEQVLRDLTANYFSLRQNTPLGKADIINRVIARAKARYGETNPVIAGAFIEKKSRFDLATRTKIEETNPDFADLLNELNKRVATIEPAMFDPIEEDGGDEITDENAEEEIAKLSVSDFNSANETGFDSISKWLKMYISSVSIAHTIIVDGVEDEFNEAVDENKIYYGVARAINNSRNDFERLVKLISFGELDGNTAANAMLLKLIKDSTGSKDVQSIINNIKDDYYNEYLVNNNTDVINKYIHPDRAYILQNILKGFDLWSRVSLFQTISPEVGESTTSNANVNNAVSNQIATWQQEFVNNANKNINNISSIHTELINIPNLVNNSLQEYINDNQNILKNTLGANINEATLKWIALNNLIETNGDAVLNAQDKIFHKAFSDEINTYDSKANIIGVMSFIKENVTTKNIDLIYDDKGIKSRLETLAKINALFDESVFESSFKNAEGKTIYGFQWKTFDLEFAINLQNSKFTDSMMNNGIVSYRTDSEGNDVYLTEMQDFIVNNRFLKQMYKKVGDRYIKDESSTFNKILPYFKIESLDGLRQVLSRETKEGREGDGVTFSNILTKDFDLVRLNFAVNRTKEIDGITLYPHFIANLEAKRTADFIMLPEIQQNLVSQGVLSKEAIDLMKEEIRKEYDRIRRVHKEISDAVSNLKFTDNKLKVNSTLMRELLNKDIHEKYHTGTLIRNVNQDGVTTYRGIRALEFTDNITGVLDKEYMRNELVESALNDVDLETFWNENNLDADIKKHWKNVILQQHYDKLESNNLIPLLDERWKRNGILNRQKYEHFIISGFLNTLSFNQLMHGDGALLFKNDGADFAKRKGGANAAIQSAETFLIAPNLGITESKTIIKFVTADEMQSVVAYDPGTGNGDKFKGNTIDQADAQNYSTTEYKRYLLWSQGKLDKFIANLLDDLELGYELTVEQQSIILENKSFLNVDKTVAYNGIIYLKKSDFMLTKGFTSVLTEEAERKLSTLGKYSEEAKAIRRDENNWIAGVDTKFHHDVRRNMEGWRENNNGTFIKHNDKKYDLYMPISASKMLNTNVFNTQTGWNNIDNSIMNIPAKNYGLQLENPAGKKRIIDPSQMTEIIFNEQQDTAKVWYENQQHIITALEDTYQELLAQRDNGVFDLAYNQIFNENDEFDAGTFYPKMVDSLISTGSDPQVIELFKLNTENLPMYNPNMGITKEKFTNQLFAHFTKGVLQQKVAGDALAHISSYGIKPLKEVVMIEKYDDNNNSIGFDYTWKVVSRNSNEAINAARGKLKYEELKLESDKDSSVIYDPTLDSDRLRIKLKEIYEGAQRGENTLYFSDELRHLKPRYKILDYTNTHQIVSNNPIAYYSESLQPAYKIDDQIIGKHNIYSFGVRIPSQDKHSAVNVEWVDALPLYYGNSIMTAKEIVTISGSDFDIDKLFVHRPELYKQDGVYRQYSEDGDNILQYVEFMKDYMKGKFTAPYNKMLATIEINTPDYFNKLNDLIKTLRLPEISEFNNPYVVNNKILNLKQIALTNDGTLKDIEIKDEDGNVITTLKATYKTAATMDQLKELDGEGSIFGNVFEQTDNLPNHIFDKHSVVHTKNSVGKQNINPYVNGNLGLILAVRLGLKINNAFQIEINGHKIEEFKTLSQDNQREFDTLSTLISAATDEAKEQLNAKYNLNLDGAGIVKTMVSLGFNLSTSIAFVNQPIIQRYLKEKQARVQTVYIENEYNSDSDIIEKLVGDLKTAYNGEYNDEDLGLNLQGLDNNIPPALFDKRLIRDLLVIDQVSDQLSKLTRFLKLKKGFVQGLDQLDKLNSAVNDLFSPAEELPIDTLDLVLDKAAQVKNFVNNIIPKMNGVANKLLLERNSGLIQLKDVINSQLKSSNQKTRESINKEIESYLFMRLFLEETNNDTSTLTPNLYKRGGDHVTVGQTLIKLKQEVNRIKVEGAKTNDEVFLSNLIGTSILKRLTVKDNFGNDELKLDTFAKLSTTEQDTLITSYSNMIKNLSYLSDDKIEYKNLPQQLFSYWVMKDAFQSKFGSISKLFPVHMFDQHSNSIDRALKGYSEIFNAMSGKSYLDVYTKDILYRLALNSANFKLFKNFYSPINMGAMSLHEQGTYDIDLSKLNSKKFEEKALILTNYPIKFSIEDGKFSITQIALYAKSKSTDYNTGNEYKNILRLRAFQLKDGRAFFNNNPKFISELNNNTDFVAKLSYKVVDSKVNTFSSSMTIDLNYSTSLEYDSENINEPIEEFIENVENENTEDNVPGCNNSTD